MRKPRRLTVPGICLTILLLFTLTCTIPSGPNSLRRPSFEWATSCSGARAQAPAAAH